MKGGAPNKTTAKTKTTCECATGKWGDECEISTCDSNKGLKINTA